MSSRDAAWLVLLGASLLLAGLAVGVFGGSLLARVLPLVLVFSSVGAFQTTMLGWLFASLALVAIGAARLWQATLDRRRTGT